MRVLIADENRKLARLIERALSEEGYAVDRCSRGAEVLRRMSATRYDIVVIDRATPDVDGIDVCRELRRSGSNVALLLMSTRDGVSERVFALDSGADDYIVKPFELHELRARIRALLRRSTTHEQLRLGPLEIDRIDRRVLLDGKAIEVTVREFALLLHLVYRSDRVVTRSELLTHVWSIDFDPGSNVVEAQIRRLRRRLGPHAWMIETVRTRGYRLRGSRER